MRLSDRREVVDRGTTGDLHARRNPDLRQTLKRPVDRRAVNRRLLGFEGSRYLVGTQMLAPTREHLEHGTAGTRDSLPRLTKHRDRGCRRRIRRLPVECGMIAGRADHRRMRVCVLVDHAFIVAHRV